MTNEIAIRTLEYIKLILLLDGHSDRELAEALNTGIFALNNEKALSQIVTAGEEMQ